jgi:hypothetical protein
MPVKDRISVKETNQAEEYKEIRLTLGREKKVMVSITRILPMQKLGLSKTLKQVLLVKYRRVLGPLWAITMVVLRE